MYSWEIQELLKLREYIISNKEYIRILETSPQIREVYYKPYEDMFYIKTDDRCSFKFKVYRKDK